MSKSEYKRFRELAKHWSQEASKYAELAKVVSGMDRILFNATAMQLSACALDLLQLIRDLETD